MGRENDKEVRKDKRQKEERNRVSLNRYFTKTVGSARRLCVVGMSVCIIIYSILFKACISFSFEHPHLLGEETSPVY